MADLYQIREHLADWIAGTISLSEFEDWFVPATWNIRGDVDLIDLVDEIELNISEYSGGYLSAQLLKTVMRKLIGQPEEAPAAPIAAGSACAWDIAWAIWMTR